jgi:uncharacterized membrane protein YeaQ/YmgE (transglycosylase-associated protein family)
MIGSKTERVEMLENVSMGVFGAFIGGDYIASLVHGVLPEPLAFRFDSLLMALGGAVVIMLLLKLMRHKVGAMRKSKAVVRKRDY